MFSEIDRHRNEFVSPTSGDKLPIGPVERRVKELKAADQELPVQDYSVDGVHEAVANASFNPSAEPGPHNVYSPVSEAEEITRQAVFAPIETGDPHVAALNAASSIQQLAEDFRKVGV